MNDLKKETGEFFYSVFGETSLSQRLHDILGEALELNRFTTLANIREETGDLLASVLSLCHEANFDINQLLAENREKIIKRKEQYRSLGRKTRVAILGGAFNPVHCGHIAIAQFVLNVSKYFDQVWLMPCYAHSYGKELISHEHRLQMCKLAAEIDARIQVSDFEIQNRLSGETFHTVKLLMNHKDYKNTKEFSWIIGMDNANNAVDKWINFVELEKMIPFVVVPRKGEKRNLKINWYLNKPHIYLEPDDKNLIPNISSTYVRECFDNTNPGYYGGGLSWVGEKVYNYIIENKLYAK